MQLMKGTDISWYYITEEKDIPQVISIVTTKSRLAFDTEVRALPIKDASVFDPHTSQIRLIQLNWDDNEIPIIIDVLKIGVEKVKPLIHAIASADILKLIHQGTYDLKQVKSTFGVWMQNVHCTRVAMQSLGISVGYKGSTMRGHSLKSLARDYFGITLDKVEGNSDWGAVDLRLEQLEYAALDVGSSVHSGIKSILLEGYDLLKASVCTPVPFGFGSPEVFEADQQGMYVAAISEYNGMYIDRDELHIIEAKAFEEMERSRHSLCAALELSLDQEIRMNDDGIPQLFTVVPERVATLLNNNKKLVIYINNILAKTGSKLDSLQAKELERALNELSKAPSDDEDEDDEEITDEDLKDYGIEVIKDLLNYKKYAKLLSESRKYESIINPVTGRVHAGFNSVGASTGRMSSSGDLNLQQVSGFTFDVEEDIRADNML